MRTVPSSATASGPQDPALALIEMIAAEDDPARKALLEFALGIVLANPSIGAGSAER